MLDVIMTSSSEILLRLSTSALLQGHVGKLLLAEDMDQLKGTPAQLVACRRTGVDA